jgi:subtilase family serine protease
VRRFAGAVMSIGSVVLASQFLAPATEPVAAMAAAPACGAAPAGTARCLGLFLQLGAHRATAPGAGPAGGLAPAEIRSAYNLPAAGAHGRTVAIVDAFDDPNAEADLGVYRAAFGLPACTTANGCFHKVDQRGGSASYPAADPGWSQEIALDLDMVSAACPDCHILLVEADNADMPSLGQAEITAATHPGVVAVSNSFGSTESPVEVTWDALYFIHPGVSIVAASGDSGYGAMYPAASPLVTAVGGTSLTQSGGPRGWTETGWGSSGSGCSSYEPAPIWQQGTGCSRRSVADVAAVADPATGVAVYDSFQSKGWTVAGGTSAASPIVASVYALAGNTLLMVGASHAYVNATALTDILQGQSNTLLCLFGNSCRPGPGYDGPTGLGSPWGLGAF